MVAHLFDELPHGEGDRLRLATIGGNRFHALVEQFTCPELTAGNPTCRTRPLTPINFLESKMTHCPVSVQVAEHRLRATPPAGRRQVRRWRTALAAAAVLAAAPASALDTRLLASGLQQPLFATQPLAGGPLFVVEKGGSIKSVLGGVTHDFLDIAVATQGEQGLLGLAFDPDFGNAASLGYRRFFVNYIDPGTLDTVVASYRSSAADPLLADSSSRVEVLRIDQPQGRTNHKAGWLGFKPGDEDHLYIATGDGGGGYDPDDLAQNNGQLLGKILRVDVNGDDFGTDADRNYAVPADNPLVGTAGARGEIFATGLRNPFRNSFDRANGNLWIADVGQDEREELNLIDASSAGGQNFGWRIREGDIATPSIGDPDPGGLSEPLLAYGRSFGGAITGGYVVREAASPLSGQYVFGDFISGRVWAIDGDGSAQSMTDAIELTAALNAGAGGPLSNIASFGEGADGALFIVDYDGKVVQVVPEPGSAVLILAGLGLLLGRWHRRRQPTPAD